MVVVNLTRDKVWVRQGVVAEYPSVSPPKFDIAGMGGLVIPAPRNKREDFQEQSIRDAEIPPDDYYPPGYKPELIPKWPTDKPIFIPAEQVPAGLWLHGKPAAVSQPGADANDGATKK
jgi:ribonuclease Z